MQILDIVGPAVILTIAAGSFLFLRNVPAQPAPKPRPAAAPAPLTLGKLVLGVFLGILLAGAVAGIVFALLTAR
jgi:predicted lipid-binding transport protein (Tim44 family)